VPANTGCARRDARRFPTVSRGSNTSAHAAGGRTLSTRTIRALPAAARYGTLFFTLLGLRWVWSVVLGRLRGFWSFSVRYVRLNVQDAGIHLHFGGSTPIPIYIGATVQCPLTPGCPFPLFTFLPLEPFPGPVPIHPPCHPCILPFGVSVLCIISFFLMCMYVYMYAVL